MTILLRQKPLPQVVRQIVQRDNGAWFDPSDMSTLYQDAAGTTPVTAVEQPVGLMLDKARGLTLGPELQPTNNIAGFSSGQSGVTWNDTSFTNTIAGRGVAKQLFIIGKFYSVTANISSNTEVTLNTSDGPNPLARTQLRVGSGTTIFKADTSFLYIRNTNPGTTTINSLTVKELYGYHATQSITASRPTLSARKNVLLATETLATQSVTTLAATYTLSFTGTGSVTLSGTATGTLTGTGTDRVSLTVTPTAGTLTLTVSGSVTKAQLGLGSVVTSYQRVTTATDYDVSAHYYYLRFDEVDDYLNLPYMGLYAAGSASVVAGVSLNNSASQYVMLSESSGGSGTSLYYLGRQAASSGQFDMLIRNDASVVALDSSGITGISNSIPRILSCIDSGALVTGFNNSSSIINTTYSRANPTTLAATTIGATVTASAFNFANMNLYGLIITKSALTDSQRVACERYLGRKSGVQL